MYWRLRDLAFIIPHVVGPWRGGRRPVRARSELVASLRFSIKSSTCEDAPARMDVWRYLDRGTELASNGLQGGVL